MQELLATPEADAAAIFRHQTAKLHLAYRPDLPTIDETKRELEHWRHEEQTARAAGEAALLRDAHAEVERRTRRLLRLETLPAGKSYPYSFTVARTGGLLWIVSLTLAGYFFGNLPFIKNNLTLVILAIIAVSLLPACWAWLKSKNARAQIGAD